VVSDSSQRKILIPGHVGYSCNNSIQGNDNQCNFEPAAV
jgi:hypothetical protein